MQFNIKRIKGRGLDEADARALDAYVDQHPEGTLYHRAVWHEIIRRSFGHVSYVLTCQDALGRIVGYLPLVHIDSRIFGNRLVSMPFFNYGGVLGDFEDIERRLMIEAARLAQEIGVDHVELRQRKTKGWVERTDKVTMVCDLPASSEMLWKAIGSKVRAQVERPNKEGVEVIVGKGELVDEFYSVFTQNMRDLGTPVYGRRLFVEVLANWPESWIVSVRVRSRAAAVGVLLGYKRRIEIPWASSLRELNWTGANMRMYWECLRHAIEKGYDWFDFGRSTKDSGPYRFKKQWGAKEEQLTWNYWLAGESESVPNISPSNPKYSLAIHLWQRMPLPAANVIGPHIARFLA